MGLISGWAYKQQFTVFGEHGHNGSYTIMAKPIRALELHYPMIQFLIILISLCQQI